MSENIPLALRNKLKSKKKYQLPNKNVFNKKYEYFKQNKYKIFFYISFAINIISFIYIFFLKKSKSSNITNLFPQKSFENNNETIDNSDNTGIDGTPVLDYTKDQLLKMCYKTRALYFTEERKKQTEHYLYKYHDINMEIIQNKINYLTIHESPDYKSKIVDKIGVHEYSKKVLGKDICVPILKIYSDANEINLDELPSQFVLKCNHGAAMNIFVKDKSNFNLNDAKYNLNKWKNIDFGKREGEFQYINVERKIFAEIYLKDDIEDYKIYCFHGEPKLIRVQKWGKPGMGKINNYYTMDWKLTDLETGKSGFYRDPDANFEKPPNYDLMLSYAKKLSAEFVFVRVDFYDFNNTVYLGEMTFTPSNGQFTLKNLEQSKYLGSFLDITKIKSYLFN
jgi:hypothetical protein